jgi:hypothetical protein
VAVFCAVACVSEGELPELRLLFAALMRRSASRPETNSSDLLSPLRGMSCDENIVNTTVRCAVHTSKRKSRP